MKLSKRLTRLFVRGEQKIVEQVRQVAKKEDHDGPGYSNQELGAFLKNNELDDIETTLVRYIKEIEAGLATQGKASKLDSYRHRLAQIRALKVELA